MADRASSWRGFGPVWGEIRQRLRLLVAAVRERPVAALALVGIGLRLSAFVANRSFWLDEASLWANIARRNWSSLLDPMLGTQLVPAGFLAVQVGLASLLGTGQQALRLLPLLGGIASVLGFVALSGRVLDASTFARLTALAVFAVAGDLVYFSNELKPYGTDVVTAIVLMIAGLGAAARAPTGRACVGLAALGAVAVWFSFPSAFVLGAVGLVLIGSAARRRDWRGAAALGAVCLVWLVSFAVSFRVARRLLGEEGSEGMQAFWTFAFPPWPPSSLFDASWPLRRLVYLFANPLDYHSRLAPGLSPWTAIAAAALGGLGVLSMRRRRPIALLILVGPVALALAAAYTRLYPFHGRLVLFTAPALILLVGEGAGALTASSRGRWARVLVVALLVAPPLGRAAYRWVQEDWDLSHNAVGDLRPFRVDAPGSWF